MISLRYLFEGKPTFIVPADRSPDEKKYFKNYDSKTKPTLIDAKKMSHNKDVNCGADLDGAIEKAVI